MIHVEWRGKPVWVVRSHAAECSRASRRSIPALADPNSNAPQQPPVRKNEHRSIKPRCWCSSASARTSAARRARSCRSGPESGLGEDWPGGFFCPCHGSKFDLAGRVFKDVPAPTNLVVPPHKYLTDTRL